MDNGNLQMDIELLPKEISSISVFGSLTLGKLVPGIITFIICLIGLKIVVRLTDRVLAKSKRIDGTLQGFIRSSVKILMWLMTATIVADTMGIKTTSIVALFSVAGLALSLSIQNLMANLFSGVTLLISKPFLAGNMVEIAGRSGNVKSIGLFYTVLETPDNMVINIPNGDVTSSAIINYSTEPMRRVDMVFSTSYDDETEDVRAAILEVIKSDERIFKEPQPFVAINEFKASSIDYAVRLWCDNTNYWDVYFSMNEKVRKSFKERGISMTYEHLNVHVVEK